MLKPNPVNGQLQLYPQLPEFLFEDATIESFQTGITYHYVGESDITFNYDSEPYPIPAAVTGFNLVNSSTFNVTIVSDGGNYGFTLTPNQALRDIQILDNGSVWEISAAQYINNIYDLQQTTDKGNVTTNPVIIRNNPDTYRTRYSIIGQGVQRDDLGFELRYYDNGITKIATGSKTWQFQVPDLTANANSSSYLVQCRPNVSGTVAYLEDIGVFSIATKTADYTVNSSDCTILCDTSLNDITISLPSAASVSGRIYNIKKIIAANTVIVDPNGSETIDGQTTQSITLQWTNLKIQSNGTNWFIL